ncbi:MAG: chromosome segregation protein SMC [Ignavibacteriales bacterium]|nr:chromosome segregation protein SMC [Ignavibacteriales bacterium]
MYLSKLEVFGFKSFAQKINLTFDAGITSIVGPNGCGKTNVVDAIRWALGEQRPTTLRSDKMEDVIFNGTKNRKPLNVAEVSLTIENTKGILPTEYSEVVITRRVYRSGESEYYLNKTLCRLKDIKDLFMDTGMGPDAYSVIELKMVETILSDKADERRRLFEEAAGVTKYKHRRKEAYRRLESVQHDLTRVGDIVREVQKAVNSLERQAQKAERYNEHAKHLHGLEINLLAREYASIATKIAPLQEQLAVAVTEKNKINVELSQEETLLDVLRTEMQELEDRMAETQAALTQQQTIVHHLERTIATSNERRKSLTVNIERYEKEKIQLREREEELNKKQEEFEAKLGEVKQKSAAAEKVYLQKKAELDTFEQQLNAKKAEMKAHQERVIALLHEISAARNREGQAKARRENIRGRIDYTTEENQIAGVEIEKDSELVTALTSEDKELRRRHAEAEVLVRQMEDRKVELQKEIDHLRNRDFELRSAIERKQSKMDFLKGLVENLDGFSEGARYLIKSDDWKSTIETTVSEGITVNPRYRIAIETALGEASGYVVVETIDHAYTAIDFLKKNLKGKATFICLDRLPKLMDHRPMFSESGVMGWAATLVQTKEKYRGLYQFLLDDTLIVDDVGVAREIIERNHNMRCVTLEGEIVTNKGVVRGGSVRQDEGGHIGQHSQLAELAEEVRGLETQREHLQKEIEGKIDELSRIDIKQLAEEARTIEQRMTGVEVRIATLEFEKRRASESIERNKVESGKLEQEITTLSDELAHLVPALQKLEEDKAEVERLSGVASSELETMEALWNEYSRIANEANVQVLSLKSEERSIQQEIEYAATTIKSIAATFDQRTADIAAAKEEIEQLGVEIQETEEALVGAREEFTSLTERKKAAEQEVTTKRSQVHEIELKLKDERQKHEGSLKAAHDLEFKIQELTMKSENLKARAKEEFEIELQVQTFEDNEAFDFTAAREEVRTLKEKIRALGAVNFAAFDEYKSEKERLDFVNAQRTDLVQSEQTLLTTIEEINATAQRQFLDTFGKIRDNFILTFKGLFDEGDECDLRLEEGVDLLEARIEIIAKPRGKRPTSIDLLSGGEKTLTAIALLFAIYLVKPSPFCILDEVDAPLDDSNIDRFTRILRKFSDNTQFIVVTHNKRTMESANALYGVTMEEEGISKLVSVRFNESVAST